MMPVTTAIAIYGAVVSSLLACLTIFGYLPRVSVRYSVDLLNDLLEIEAIRHGGRDVRISRVLLAPPGKFMAGMLPDKVFNASSVRLPHTIEPHSRMQLKLPLREVGTVLHAMSFTGPVSVRIVFEDETHRRYQSKPLTIPVEDWAARDPIQILF